VLEVASGSVSVDGSKYARAQEDRVTKVIARPGRNRMRRTQSSREKVSMTQSSQSTR
jgi:hypothetical protein